MLLSYRTVSDLVSLLDDQSIEEKNPEVVKANKAIPEKLKLINCLPVCSLLRASDWFLYEQIDKQITRTGTALKMY